MRLEDNDEISTANCSGHFVGLRYIQTTRGTPMTTESEFHNKYSLVKGAARRARQLQSGAQPLIAAKSTKACRVAQDEIKQGQVKYVLADRPATKPQQVQ